MKQLSILIVGISLGYNSHAQGIFNQKAGQIKNLIKQIALLEVHIGYLEKGYDIAKKGLTTISDIKNGDLHLHLDNFNSLKAVNPRVKKYLKVADIIALQLQIIQVYKTTLKQIKSNDLFNPNEIEYIYNVFTKLLEQCAININELITLTTSGEYEMKDDERLKRIDALEMDMQDKYAFAQNFGQGAQAKTRICLGKRAIKITVTQPLQV
ncbi:MAG: hypothetical protein ABIQ31_05450 [Ferruginibacter sp.]